MTTKCLYCGNPATHPKTAQCDTHYLEGLHADLEQAQGEIAHLTERLGELGDTVVFLTAKIKESSDE